MGPTRRSFALAPAVFCALALFGGPGAAVPGPATAGEAASVPQRRDPVDALARWIERWARPGGSLDAESEQELIALVGAVRRIAKDEPDRRREVAAVLLDLAGAVPKNMRAAARDGRWLPDREVNEVRRVGRSALEPLLEGRDGALVRWITHEVLANASRNPLERRVEAARLLRGRYRPGTLLALFNCASAPERSLRDAAVASLSGWDEDSVHRFLAGQLIKAWEDPSYLALEPLREHFEEVSLLPSDPAARELKAALASALLAPEWRDALRAAYLLSALADELAIAPLIEALGVWKGREERGGGSKRVVGSIVAELERRSGRRIGPFPERWSSWWRAVVAGRIEPGPRDDTVRTAAQGFFGLRPYTDQVVFVIDRSGSMDAQAGTGGRTRYEEALDQMVEFLEGLGETTRFNIVLFSHDTMRWRSRLQTASPHNLAAARSWARNLGPKGGTRLMPAVMRVLELDGQGQVDLERLEADTVIVLCDGATEEGASWVEPLIAKANQTAMLVFHTVQIGAGGDGTLERLAELTGGESLRITH